MLPRSHVLNAGEVTGGKPVNEPVSLWAKTKGGYYPFCAPCGDFFFLIQEVEEREGGRRGGKLEPTCWLKRKHGERREHGPAPGLQRTQHASEAAHARAGGAGGEICNRFGKKEEEIRFYLVCLFVPSMLQCPGTWTAVCVWVCVCVCRLDLCLSSSLCFVVKEKKGHSTKKKESTEVQQCSVC